MTVPPTVVVEGCITRKRKRQEHIVLSIQPDNQAETRIPVERNDAAALQFCYVGAVVRVTITGERQQRIDLVLCAPDPVAVNYVMNGILNREFPEWTLPSMREELELITSLQPRDRRLAVAKIVRQLNGQNSERDPRIRMPHTKRQYLELLDSMVEERQLIPITAQTSLDEQESTQPDNAGDKTTPLLNVPSMNQVSYRGSRTRVDYLNQKKEPQVQWMVQRAQQLSAQPHSILDVGGGRGDLATALACTFPGVKVTIVDKNESSLVAGKEYATSRLGVEQMNRRINFVHADFQSYQRDYVAADEESPIDLVIALHACGDLSDLAMTFAVRQTCSFVVCPCCYTKRMTSFVPPWFQSIPNPSQLSVITRLAELNERPNVSKKAMHFINSLRLGCIPDENWKVSLEEFESKSSLRNLVLIGEYDHGGSNST